jgi:hypothetical protein
MKCNLQLQLTCANALYCTVTAEPLYFFVISLGITSACRDHLTITTRYAAPTILRGNSDSCKTFLVAAKIWTETSPICRHHTHAPFYGCRGRKNVADAEKTKSAYSMRINCARGCSKICAFENKASSSSPGIARTSIHPASS